MHDDREQAEERIRRTVRERIRPAVHGPRVPFDVTAWHLPGEPVLVEDARSAVADGAFAPFEIGGRWGKPWGTTWFRLQGAVPADWEGETVEARVDFAAGAGPGFQSEGLIYPTAGGGPVRGIHPLHQHVPVEVVADERGQVDVLVEAAANPIVVLSQQPTPLGDPATAGDDLQYRLHAAELAVRHDEVYHLDLDMQIAVGLMRSLPTDHPRRYELLRAVDAAIDALDLHDLPASAAAARGRLVEVLSRPAAAHAHRLSAAGHAHIDSAWLWPLRETRRKCARTFANQLALMDEYPEHRFVCSQAAQYEWIEHDQPELFERIRARVAEGRFVPVGSMWVEADANLPSGESLARQLVWGKRYFADRFAVDTTEVWLPDVFGYSAALPQLLAHAGCRWFLTQKLSWNTTNPFPHHSFWWEGLDGTRVFAHFPPADTYNGDVKVGELAFAVSNFRDKGRASRSMYLYGHGDGGGGPTREMLERARRVADLDGVPRVAIESPEEFFAAAIEDYPDASVWRGELYFEMHRGTYTSQAETKMGNRRGELALRELEVWTALDDDPPLADLERLWKVLLLHQFHDIIPGSSIAWVHDDTEAAHAEVLAECEQLIAHALEHASRSGPSDRSFSTESRVQSDEHNGSGPSDRSFSTESRVQSGDAVAANAGPFGFIGVVGTGEGDGGGGPVWAEAPAHGIGATSPELPAGIEPVSVVWAETSGTGARSHTLDNGLVRATIGNDGTLASLVDRRADRECLAAPANVLQLFPDHPNTYDAWDVEAHTFALDPELLTGVDSVGTFDDGPMRAGVEVRRSFGSSTVVQRYVLSAGSARLDIETDVDWHEDEKLLKAAFPFDVRADDARYDIQYGHVRRPTHRNTSWDAARFEVCGHFWADLAEPDFGVALLNDGKYGHDCLDSTMRLSLLRAPNYPDPDADRGRHRFTYSVLPHGPGLADVVAESWALNLPPRVVTGAPRPSVVAADHPGIVITAVKAADDGSGDLVVRAHEAFGGRARTVLTTAWTYRTVTPCDLLERPTGDPVPVHADGHRLELRPFQLVTLRFTR